MPRKNSTTPGPDPGSAWFEHTAAGKVSAELVHVFELSRRDPRPWHPIPLLVGAPGSGKSAICGRLIAQVGARFDLRTTTDAGPVASIVMPNSCDAEEIKRLVTRLRGFYDDGDQRTSLVFVENADALIDVSVTKRNLAISKLHVDFERILFVLVGTQELARTLAPDGKYEVIHLAPLVDDDEFASLVAHLGGTDDEGELARLHRLTGGVVGRVLALGRRGGLGRPDAGEAEVLRLLPVGSA